MPRYYSDLYDSSLESLYDPLLGDEVRLLRVKPENIPIISCEMVHVSMLKQPKFWAFSYTWGSMEHTEKILVNNAGLNIPANLYAALLEFRALLRSLDSDAEIPYLWIDSICLNQANRREKSIEIPRMGVIFRQCERVLAWLGPVGSDEDQAVHELTAKMKHFESTAEKSGTTVYEQIQEYQNARDHTSTAERERLRATLNAISERAWFKRVWIVQETTLAFHDPVMLLGLYMFSFETYFALQLCLNSGQTPTAVSSNALCHAMVRASFRLHPAATTEDRDMRQRSAFDMLEFMFHTARLQASVPHDYIYGLIGLMRHGAIPYELQPRYEEPVEVVYYTCARYILSQTSHLGVLSLGRVGGMPGVPSWVPDFSNRNPHIGEFKSQFVDLKLIEWCILAVPGIVLGRCISTFSAKKAEDFSTDPLQTFAECDNAIFAAAARVKGVSSGQVFEKWLRSRLPRAVQTLSIPDGYDLSSLVQSLVCLYKHLVHRENIDERGLSPKEQASLSYAEQLLQQPAFHAWMFGSDLFVLEDGSTGSIPSPVPNVRPGDLLCVFPALNQPLAIRFVGGEQHVKVQIPGELLIETRVEGLQGPYCVNRPRYSVGETDIQRNAQLERRYIQQRMVHEAERDGCFTNQHRILGHALVDGCETYEEFSESFLLSSEGQRTKHQVTKFYLV